MAWCGRGDVRVAVAVCWSDILEADAIAPVARQSLEVSILRVLLAGIPRGRVFSGLTAFFDTDLPGLLGAFDLATCRETLVTQHSQSFYFGFLSA